MGQSFKIMNLDEKEYFTGNGGMKALERVSDPIGMGMLGYLMLQGPQDGTRFSGLHNFNTPNFHDEMAEKMDEERDRHRNEGRTSSYRNDDGSWDKQRLGRVIAAGHDISEDFIYAGRWAGDRIAIVGDYDDSGLYDESQQQWVYEYEGAEFTNYATTTAPVVPESIEQDGIVHSVADRDVEPGDLCEVRHPDKDEKVYAEFVRVADTEWVDITDRLRECFEEFVGQGWIDDHDDSWLMRPDMLIGQDDDGDMTVFSGSVTAAMTNEEISLPGDGENEGSDTEQISLSRVADD